MSKKAWIGKRVLTVGVDLESLEPLSAYSNQYHFCFILQKVAQSPRFWEGQVGRFDAGNSRVKVCPSIHLAQTYTMKTSQHHKCPTSTSYPTQQQPIPSTRPFQSLSKKSASPQHAKDFVCGKPRALVCTHNSTFTQIARIKKHQERRCINKPHVRSTM